MTDEIEPPELPDLVAASRSGDMRTALEALRDILAHEIQGNRCKTCQMTQMRTGEFSSLALRLQKVLEDLQALPARANPSESLPEGVTSLESIRDRRPSADPDRLTGTESPPHAAHGTKNAERRQGGRKPRR